MFKYFIALVSVLFIVACGSNNSTQEDADLFFEGDTITVKNNSPILGQIIIQNTELQDFSAEFRTVGNVRPISGNFAEIASPFAGRIVKSHIKLGQKVGIGSPIFELSSAEFYEAVKTYFAAQSVNEVAQRNYNRQKELTANGVAAQKDFDEAQSEANIAQHEFEQAKASLRIFNVETDNYTPLLQMGQPLRIVSPIVGEVIKSNITIGSYVKEDTEPLAVIADVSKVWVAALVKEKYFGSIKKAIALKFLPMRTPIKLFGVQFITSAKCWMKKPARSKLLWSATTPIEN